MIAKVKSNNSLDKTIDYHKKEKSELIGAVNLVGKGVEDFRMQMKDTQACFKGRAKKLTLHAILSPSIEDGKRLTRNDWKGIAHDYLKGMKLLEQQAIIFLHTDRSHKHLHLVINLVHETTCKVWRSKINDVTLSHRVGHQIAEERGLKNAKEIMKENRTKRAATPKLKSGPVGNKQRIAQELDAITFVNVESYFAEIVKKGFQLKKYFDKETKEVRGYGVGKYGTFLDASKIGKRFTLKELKKKVHEIKISPAMIKKFEEGLQTDVIKNFDPVARKQVIIDTMTEVLKLFSDDLRKVKFDGIGSYFRNLEKAGFKVKAHLNKATGAISGYGVTKYDQFYNASEIGKEFTLTSLKIKFEKEHPAIKLKPKSIRQIIADEISNLKYTTAQDYFKELTRVGFEVKPLFNIDSKEPFNYGFTRYGLYFEAIEIGKKFTLESLKNQKPNLIVLKASQPPRSDETPTTTITTTSIKVPTTQRQLSDTKPNSPDYRSLIANELRKIKFRDFDSYFVELKAKGFEANAIKEEATGRLVDYSVRKYGQHYKASMLGEEFTVAFLMATMAKKKTRKRLNRIQ